MERLATGVETQRAVILSDMHVQTDVGVGHRYIRALAGLLPELVDDGILYLIRHELRMAELLREHDRVDREGLVVLQILRPVYFLDFLIHVICAFRFEMTDRLQDSDGSVQLEVCTIHHFFITCKRYHSSTDLNIVSPQLGQLFRQYRFQSHKRFGDQFKILFHCIAITGCKVNVS